MRPDFTIGIDYGTNSVRAIVVDTRDGRIAGTHVVPYPSGDQGVWLDPDDVHLARQHPGDYLVGLEASVRGAIDAAERWPDFAPERVVGIGVDTTGSTPLPVDASCRPLALDPRWRDHPAAQAWLWKDHTAADEAAAITATAAAHAPHLLAPIGGTYSSEWFWSKIWRCLKVAPDVFEAAESWVELADYIPAVLTGVTRSRDIARGVCAAGHKAMFSRAWGGLPDAEFLARLDPRLAALRERLFTNVVAADRAGRDVVRGVGRPARRAGRAGSGHRRVRCALRARSAPASAPARWSRSSAPRPATALSRRVQATCATSPASAASSKTRSCRATTASKRGSRRWVTCSSGGSRACARAARRCTRP